MNKYASKIQKTWTNWFCKWNNTIEQIVFNFVRFVKSNDFIFILIIHRAIISQKKIRKKKWERSRVSAWKWFKHSINMRIKMNCIKITIVFAIVKKSEWLVKVAEFSIGFSVNINATTILLSITMREKRNGKRYLIKILFQLISGRTDFQRIVI